MKIENTDGRCPIQHVEKIHKYLEPEYTRVSKELQYF